MARIAIARGEIWRARFPFQDDLMKGKTRPCLILGWTESSAHSDQKVWVMPFSSLSDGDVVKKNDYEVKSWQECNLSQGSYLRTGRVASVDFETLQERIGTATQDLVDAAFQAVGDNLTRK